MTDAAATVVENRDIEGSFGVELHNSDQAAFRYTRHYEVLPRDFAIAPQVVVPAGAYSYSDTRVSYRLGQQRTVSGTLAASSGTLYGGTKTTASYTGRLGFSARFVLEPGMSLNWVSLSSGDFTAALFNTRVIVTPLPRLMVSGLVQLNASANTLTSSVRLSWEYVPGSELFVVYSDGRNTPDSQMPGLLNRSIAVKVTRLFRF